MLAQPQPFQRGIEEKKKKKDKAMFGWLAPHCLTLKQISTWGMLKQSRSRFRCSFSWEPWASFCPKEVLGYPEPLPHAFAIKVPLPLIFILRTGKLQREAMQTTFSLRELSYCIASMKYMGINLDFCMEEPSVSEMCCLVAGVRTAASEA